MHIKKKIAILEFDYHAEVLRNTLIIFSNLDYDIEVYTIDNIWKKVNIPVQAFFKVFTCTKSNVNQFVTQSIEQINSNDIIIFNTLASKFKLYSKQVFKKPVIVRVHNANFTLQALKSLYPKLTPFFIWKHTSYIVIHLFLKLDLFYKQKFFKEKVDFYSFPNDEIKNYLIDSSIINPEKTMGSFPFLFNNNEINNTKKSNNKISISVIGTIDKRRRDYVLLHKVLKSVLILCNIDVELKLLGKPFGPYGKKMIEKFKSLENNSFQLTSYSEFIPQDEFEKHIEETDFFIIPVPEKTHYKIYKELYGKTKISGNITDMVVFNRPAILPSYYLLSPALKEVTSQYNSRKELEDILNHWLVTKEYKAFDFANINNNFSLDKTAQIVQKSIDAIINQA